MRTQRYPAVEACCSRESGAVRFPVGRLQLRRKSVGSIRIFISYWQVLKLGQYVVFSLVQDIDMRQIIRFAGFLVALAILVSQTVSTQVLKELTGYYGAAARLIANTITSVNGVQPDTPGEENDHGQVVKDLKSISFAISRLRVSQTPLVIDLSDYINQVRSGRLNGSDRNKKWGSIVASSSSLKGTVATTLDVVERSGYLKVALEDRDRLALRETLMGRGLVLSKLESLPAPGSRDEIDQLEKMNRFYSQLVKSLGDLNIALLGAIDRMDTN